MYDVARLFRDEVRGLMDRLSTEPAEWWTEVSDLFLPEITRAAQIQVRLGLGGVALVVRSELHSARTRLYGLLGERGLDFKVASGCERLSDLFPDAGWLLKIGLCGLEPHSRLFCDERISLEELRRVLDILDLPAEGVEVGRALLDATGAPALRYFSVAPGDPVTLEICASRPPEPGGMPSTLDSLRSTAGLVEDDRFEAMREHHGALCRYGRQRYSLQLDGSGAMRGIKVEYADTPLDAMLPAVSNLAASPALSARRLQVAARYMAMKVADHLTVRVEGDGALELSVYYNRLYAVAA
ncbi:MAG: hypothetical protein AMXMBFR64_37100 [Myxococcales bacterium]